MHKTVHKTQKESKKALQVSFMNSIKNMLHLYFTHFQKLASQFKTFITWHLPVPYHFCPQGPPESTKNCACSSFNLHYLPFPDMLLTSPCLEHPLKAVLMKTVKCRWKKKSLYEISGILLIKLLFLKSELNPCAQIWVAVTLNPSWLML